MADNSTRLNATANTETIAADEIGGILYQRVKLEVGADGTANDVRGANDIDDGTSGIGVVAATGFIYDTTTTKWMIPRSAGADGIATRMVAAAGNIAYNGATWDRQRGNTEGTLLASASRDTQAISATQTNHNARGVILTLNVTVNPAGGRTLGIDVQIVDPVSTTGLTMVAFTASTANSQTVVVYPGVPVAATNQSPWPLPRSWRVVVTPSDGAAWTYSLGYSLII